MWTDPDGKPYKLGITDLKKAGLINNPYVISGKSPRLARTFFQASRDHQACRPGEAVARIPGGFGYSPSNTSGSHDITPDEQMAISHASTTTAVNEILDSVKGVTPAGFERLVVGLLSRMGYGDGQVVGQSGDQGIDGILKQDVLGLEKVYVQAKRHTSNQVGEPEIRNFSGSSGCARRDQRRVHNYLRF